MDLISLGHFSFPITQMCQLYNMQALRPSLEVSHLYFTVFKLVVYSGFCDTLKI